MNHQKRDKPIVLNEDPSNRRTNPIALPNAKVAVAT